MHTKDIWIDDEFANDEQPTTVAPEIIEYHVTRLLPIEELNRREGLLDMSEDRSSEVKADESLFGANIRDTIRILKS